MKKIKIELPKIEAKEVEFCGKKVTIESRVSLENYEKILADIKINVLQNKEIEDKVMLIQLRCRQQIIDLCTNIKSENLSAEDLNSHEIECLLFKNIENYYNIIETVMKEYDRWIFENSFNVLGNSMPSSEDMEKSMKMLSETIEKLPSDKLEMIAKSIVWNKAPALGNAISPAEHIEGE